MAALPPDVPGGRSSLAVVTEKTLVPLALVGVALVLGYGWRDREASKETTTSDRIAAVKELMDLRTAQILTKLEVISAQVVAMNARIDQQALVAMTREEFDNWNRLLGAQNPPLQVPARAH